MSETIIFDRRKGFVALPIEVLELDLSPGAFRLLVELCRMANLEGFCWPSLGQLGEKLGRSKAAVSGYVSSLRDADLITTETQTTANGYNYRLRYCVTFWKAWRASLTGKTTPRNAFVNDHKDECSVQKNERHKDSKNQIPIKQHMCGLTSYSQLVSEWADCTKGAPYPALRHTPSEELLAKTKIAVSTDQTNASDTTTKIDQHLAETFSKLHVVPERNGTALIVQHLKEKNFAIEELVALCAAIEQGWQVHWRKVPTPKQLDRMIESAGIVPKQTQVKLLEGYLRRWALVQKTLRPKPPCEKLIVKSGVPTPPPTPTYIRGYN